MHSLCHSRFISAEASLSAVLAVVKTNTLSFTMAESVTKSPQSYDSPEHEIKRLRMRIAALEDENKRLKETNVKAMSEKEFEEEHITNRLMKRLDEVEAQKAKLTKAVQEEDVMLKDMQERMQKLQEEKAQLESELEKEHTLLVQQKK